MNPPFQCWRENSGDLWVAGGRLISINSAATLSYATNTAIAKGIGETFSGDTTLAIPASTSKVMIGGSGRNYRISGGPADPAFPTGTFRPLEPDAWDSPEFADASVLLDSGTGIVTLHDGTDVIGSTSGPLGGLSGTPSAGTFPITDWAPDGYYPGLGAYYQAVGYPGWTMFHDFVTGDVQVDNFGDPRLTRTGGSTTDPSGVWVANTQAEIDYNSGNPWTYTTVISSNAGTITASSYAESTYNGGNPFTFDVEYEGDPTGQAAIVTVDAGTLQEGRYSWNSWQEWESDDDPNIKITIDGSGAGEISDATDVIATRAADASKLYDPTGGYVYTSYGAATYGTSTNVISGSPSAGTAITQDWELFSSSGGIDTYRGPADWWIEHATVSGDALIYDGTGFIVAQRLAGSTSDIDGSYASTPYGEEVYNASSSFTYDIATTSQAVGFSVSVNLNSKPTLEGWIYVVLTINGSNEATAISEPRFAATMPANTSTEKSRPIAYSDGTGKVEQIQVGPIVWVA